MFPPPPPAEAGGGGSARVSAARRRGRTPHPPEEAGEVAWRAPARQDGGGAKRRARRLWLCAPSTVPLARAGPPFPAEFILGPALAGPGAGKIDVSRETLPLGKAHLPMQKL